MRETEVTRACGRDINRLKKGPHKLVVEPGGEFWDAVHILAAGRRLPPRYRDHPLIGNWKGYCECHIKDNLLLIYQKTDDNRLILHRLGVHEKVFKK